MTSRRQALRSTGSLVLLLAGADFAWGATILGVRVWPARAYTRVTIESDAALSARHFVAESPLRLVLDIERLELSPTLRDLVGKVRPDDPYIAAVRVGQYQPRVVRLVLDLRQAVRPEQFELPPVAAYQHRLLLDLHPAQEADPLLALLRDKQATERQIERQAAQALEDALGDLIARVDRPSASPGPAQGPVMPPAASAATAPAPPAVDTASTQASAATPPASAADGRQRATRLVIVALDPGHGGEDPGAIGPTGLREKDVVLAIALKLRDKLETQPGVRVMLTRDGDYFVPLAERVRKARRVQADLFVSIHADAFIRPTARGASVFALSERGATSATARWMAERENGADQVGGVNVAVQDTQVMRAMLDMSTSAQIRDSLRVGSEVLQHIGRVGRLHKPRVEQAGFAVLKAPDIPSILVETAFISNPDEEALLRDRAYRQQLVDALARGIRRHFAQRPPLPRARTL